MLFGRKKQNFNYEENMEKLKKEIASADAIVIGAGAGLSTAAGYTYSGERFETYFSDFKEVYGIRDMYSGGFYPFPNMETYWAWWSRHIYINRYDQPRNEVYGNLFELVKDKDYFVLTTNVDHQFQLHGFDKKRMFYMQGDYGLFQCNTPCHQETYDNEEQIKAMGLATGFLKETNDVYEVDFANRENWKMEIPSELIPYCPQCQEYMNMNLRCDDSFVQDEGWYDAKERYDAFLKDHEEGHVLYLELGVGMNTPVWIKYPFWRRTKQNKDATYACLNYGEAYAPDEIAKQSICIDGEFHDILKQLMVQNQ